MKKLIFIIASIALVSLVSSCGRQKLVPANEGDVEISLPFSSPSDMTDADYFRATGTATSPNQATAEKMATLNARTEIAASVTATLKAVTEQYTNNTSVANKQEYASKFEETARQVVNTQLEGAFIKGKKMFRSKDGSKYTAYINVEMPKANIEKAVTDAISKDDKLKLEFDKYQFQKVFDAEMAKFEQNNR